MDDIIDLEMMESYRKLLGDYSSVDLRQKSEEMGRRYVKVSSEIFLSRL